MANDNIQNTTLSEGIVFMEKCLDTMIAEQRKIAHRAIDMDDWNKMDEILAGTKNNIVRIESLKTKFAEFKEEAVKLEFLPGDKTAENTKPVEQPKPEAKPVEQPKPEPKPVEQPKPEPKPVEQPKPEPKPVEQPKPEPKPVEQPKPEPKPVEQPKPEPKPVEQPKPEPKPVEQPKPEPKPVEQPKPEPKPIEQPKPEPVENTNPKSEANSEILDMEMSDFDAAPKTKDPIVDACEELITKYPFSMRLIYSNNKIGKFFTSDDIVAENDMSKPKQLSNGLWVETNVPEEKIPSFIRGITRYCEESVNM